MNSNRGQYNATPMYNLKSKRREKKRQEGPGNAPGRKRYMALSVVMSLVLPVLFLVALLVPSNPVRWVFLGVAGLSLLLMWALGAFVRSARSTLTVIYLALGVVIGLALFMNRQTPEARNVTAARMQQDSLFTAEDPGVLNAYLNELNAPAEEEEEAQEPAEDESVPEALVRLEAFFAAWGTGSSSEMVRYCTPSWVSKQASPEATLFQMLRSTIPTSYDKPPESISGSDGDASRIVTLKVRFLDGGQEVVKRMHIMMQKVNGVWYVNPESLDGVLVDEMAEQAAREEVEQNFISSTIPPATPEPVSSGIIVYYNEQGGKYYHADRTCEAVSSEYWPLTEFSFDLINSQQFKNLRPCSKCNPPQRPNVGQ